MLDIEARAPVDGRARAPDRINEDVIRYMTIRVDEHERARR
jgi:ribosomal protein S6